MINNYFQTKFPFAYNYFSNMLEFVAQNKRKFPQALIFEGADTMSQYLFALELARVLNCQNEGALDCNCINCKWIKTHTHPCVNNVSQIHYKPDNDETKTVISVKQARSIEQNLKLTSDYYRFFIFFSSCEKEYSPFELSEFSSLGYDTQINYSIEPLDYKTFNPATPNALLKSIEEPPENTTFVFLTQSRENILPTIVSRCLVFKLSTLYLNKQNSTFNYSNLFSKYQNLNLNNIFDFCDEIQIFIKENNLTLEVVLNKFMEYLKELIKANINNNSIYLKLKNDINLINTALKYTSASMSDKIVLEALMLRLVRGY